MKKTKKKKKCRNRKGLKFCPFDKALHFENLYLRRLFGILIPFTQWQFQKWKVIWCFRKFRIEIIFQQFVNEIVVRPFDIQTRTYLFYSIFICLWLFVSLFFSLMNFFQFAILRGFFSSGLDLQPHNFYLVCGKHIINNQILEKKHQ